MSTDNTVTPRKTLVKVGIQRSLNTAQYENLQVVLELTDEITWTTPDERSKKTASLVARLNQQYIDTQTQVLNDLGVAEKRAWRKQPAQPPRSTAGDELLT